MDEFILGGEAQETSKKNVLKAIEQADMLQEVRGVVKRSLTLHFMLLNITDLHYLTYIRDTAPPWGTELQASIGRFDIRRLYQADCSQK